MHGPPRRRLGPRLLPARVRRLSNLELERAVQSLTGVASFELAKELPPDVRQEGYTPNAKQDDPAANDPKTLGICETRENNVSRESDRLND